VKPVVSERVAGKKAFSRVELKKKLGWQAVAVWELLMAHRDFDGISAMTAPAVAEQLAFGESRDKAHVVERALRMLKRAGLVTHEGKRWVKWFDDRAGKTVRRCLHVRTVLGAPTGVPDQFTVPATAALAMKGIGRGVVLEGHQKRGRRAVGAIEPDGVAPIESEGVTDLTPSLSIDQKAPIEPEGVTASVAIEPEGVNQLNPRGHVVTKESQREECLLSLRESYAHALRAHPELRSKEEVEAADKVVVSSTPLGCVIGSTTPRRTGPVFELPFHPLGVTSFSDYNLATIPSPPKLNPDADPTLWVEMLLRAYRGAVKSRFKESKKFSAKLRVIVFRRMAKLEAAARALIDHDISPFGWAAFSCDVAKEYRKAAPDLDWVFSASRIEERAGWFKSELSDYTGQKVVFPKSSQALSNRWEQLRDAVRARARSPEDVERLFREAFPNGQEEIDALVAKVRAEADAERTRLSVALHNGEWLWD